MPAHVGFLNMLKVPVFTIAQFTPTAKGKSIRDIRPAHGTRPVATPAEIYSYEKVDWDKLVKTSYKEYRKTLDLFFDPTSDRGNALWSKVDANEWDLYLKPGTAFDNAVKAVFDRNEGWTVTLVVPKDFLKRIEMKRGKGHKSIAVWSAAGSVALVN